MILNSLTLFSKTFMRRTSQKPKKSISFLNLQLAKRHIFQKCLHVRPKFLVFWALQIVFLQMFSEDRRIFFRIELSYEITLNNIKFKTYGYYLRYFFFNIMCNKHFIICWFRKKKCQLNAFNYFVKSAKILEEILSIKCIYCSKN